MSYNSLDAVNQNTIVGNKWVLNYGTYLVEDTGAGGGVVTVFMPDGAQINYYPNGQGGYTLPKGVFSHLFKIGPTRYELVSPVGDRMVYDIPAGTDSLQSLLVEVRDRFGYSLRLSYSTGFTVQLTSITDAQNKITHLFYDEAGHIKRVRDPFGREASFSYVANGNLVNAVDMEGNAFQYAYNDQIEMTQLNSAQGALKLETSYPWYGDRYSAMHVKLINAKNESEEFIWDGDGGGFSRHLDRRKAQTRFFIGQVIDGQSKVTAIENALGEVTHLEYDQNTGFPNASTDVSHVRTSVEYNSMGQVVRSVDAKNRETRFTYDPKNGIDLLAVHNSRGQQVGNFAYDNKHQLISATDQKGDTTTWAYTPWGATASVADAEHTNVITYNPSTKRAISISYDGISMGAVTHDDEGRVKTTTDREGATLTYAYNDLDKPIGVKSPDNTTTSIDYSCCSLPGVI
ncbi:MAG: RHS repeat protein, partial [Cytophagaceae bacterium]